MTRRERVLRALAFEETDRAPMDLAGMASTGISCFAYPGLVAALGLPPRRPRVYDTGQMLALPDTDVLDELDIDVATVMPDATNAFEQPELWRPYDFNGRLPALVRDPDMFETLEDGTIIQPRHGNRMPPSSHVFESDHGGQPFDLAGEIPRPDLERIREHFAENPFREEEAMRIAAHCRRAREATDRAILFCGPGAGIGIGGFTGIAQFPLLCMTAPQFVAALHEAYTQYAVATLETLLPHIHSYIDVYLVSADDWGTQAQLVAAPSVYEELFLPYYRRINDAIHRLAPGVKTFLHSCGAVYDLIDLVIASGFDVLNPVQWTAGGRGCREWKEKACGRLALWGGGVNTQSTLPLGTVADIEREVREVVSCMKVGGGYVFCAIHNILAEIPGEKVAAMYRAAATCHA
ncbi:MAG TPA: uroporphyrinogen decarboxylase family protein [Candidatus Hydrogenedentes bacterium]|nr:uroporphyrinogen decarboxylase family protein [Candidatus Hydrogenedentota bacterium]HNT87318.1 uroporphyrinogen decarboxylase family protein [Candidatus Hydrogenedentota bacterium]